MQRDHRARPVGARPSGRQRCLHDTARRGIYLPHGSLTLRFTSVVKHPVAPVPRSSVRSGEAEGGMFVAGSKADRREPYRQQICRSRACATNPVARWGGSYGDCFLRFARLAAVCCLFDIAMSGFPINAAVFVNDEAFGSTGIEFEHERDRLG